MRFDTVIIGGGLSALVCGIELARNGKRVAVVAKGHSSLHFSSGSFGLYNAEHPLKAIAELAPTHPYSKIGVERVEALAAKATEILNVAGVSTNGTVEANHYIMTPTGTLRPCWLSLEGTVTAASDKSLDFKSAAILYPEGFLDFYTQFVSDELQGLGVNTSLHSFALPELSIRRNNPTEMRSVAVARALDKEENILALANIISHKTGDAEVVIMPAVLGFVKGDVQSRLEKISGKRILTVPTLPPSVEGIKVERALRTTFERMGGVIFNGQTVVSYAKEENVVATVTTDKYVTLTAEEFVLSTGSFIGGGLESDRNSIVEPVFGVDVAAPQGEFTTRDIFEPQPFMSAGVVTDNSFKALCGGTPIDNLYACGAILSGFNGVKEGCGAGVAMVTALVVAENILNK